MRVDDLLLSSLTLHNTVQKFLRRGNITAQFRTCMILTNTSAKKVMYFLPKADEQGRGGGLVGGVVKRDMHRRNRLIAANWVDISAYLRLDNKNTLNIYAHCRRSLAGEKIGQPVAPTLSNFNNSFHDLIK